MLKFVVFAVSTFAVVGCASEKKSEQTHVQATENSRGGYRLSWIPTASVIKLKSDVVISSENKGYVSTCLAGSNKGECSGTEETLIFSICRLTSLMHCGEFSGETLKADTPLFVGSAFESNAMSALGEIGNIGVHTLDGKSYGFVIYHRDSFLKPLRPGTSLDLLKYATLQRSR